MSSSAHHTVDDQGDADPFVPPGFEVPHALDHPDFRLVPLGPIHNDRDYRAWTSSMDHIRRTPGFETYSWPHPMSPEDNLRDLQKHADDFARRTGFTYSVVSGDDVLGCVYIYPGGSAYAAVVRSWVRADHHHLDVPLYQAVREWLGRVWPFQAISYSPRDKQHQAVG